MTKVSNLYKKVVPTFDKKKNFAVYWAYKVAISVVLFYIVFRLSDKLANTIDYELKKNMFEEHKKLIVNQATDMLFYIFLAVGTMFILIFLEVPTATIATVLGTTIVAIGIGLQGTISNVFSGVINAVSDNFRIGDDIRIVFPFRTSDPIEGKVVDINVMFVQLIEKSTKKYLFIPNSLISNNMVVNMSRKIN